MQDKQISESPTITGTPSHSLPSNFPSDILLSIFEWTRILSAEEYHNVFTLDGAESKKVTHNYLSTRFPFSLAAVCRFWRATALSTSWLWSRWNVNLVFKIQSLISIRSILRTVHLLVLKALRLSGDALLDFGLDIDFRAVRMSRDLSYFKWLDEYLPCISALFKVVETLSKQQRKWRSARIIIFESNSDLQRTHNHKYTLLPEKLTSLEELRIRCNTNLVYKQPTLVPSFSLLRHLEIVQPDDYSKDSFLTFVDLEILQSVESLEELQIEFSSSSSLSGLPFDDADLPVIPVTKHKLRHFSLHISPYLPTEMMMGLNLRRWTCPNLETITLSRVMLKNLRLFDVFLERNNSLVSVDIGFGDLIDGVDENKDVASVFISCLRKLPLITSLRVDMLRLTSILIALTQKSGESFILVPRLKRITFSNANARSEIFVDFIVSRWRSDGRSLREVKLVRCYEWCGRLRGVPALWCGGSSDPDTWAAVRQCREEGLEIYPREF